MITCQEMLRDLFESYEEIYEEQYRDYVNGECASHAFEEIDAVDYVKGID